VERQPDRINGIPNIPEREASVVTTVFFVTGDYFFWGPINIVWAALQGPWASGFGNTGYWEFGGH